jgi:Tfp pilus assembly protein FimV
VSRFHLSLSAVALTLAVASPLTVSAEEAVGLRNLKILRISDSIKNISAVGQNNTDRTLPAVRVTYELSDKDGKALGIQTHEYAEIGPQQAWKISHPTAVPQVTSLRVLKIETPEADPTDQMETVGVSE